MSDFVARACVGDGRGTCPGEDCTTKTRLAAALVLIAGAVGRPAEGVGLHRADLSRPEPGAREVTRHGAQARKLAMSLRPVAWLFSGWNWVPTMVSRPTMAVIGPP